VLAPWHRMQTRTLSHTDLEVSRACVGTMTFGSQTDEATAARIVDLCADHGINFLDTANVYNLGKAETIIGTVLKGRRNRFVLASKVGMRMGNGPEESGLSAKAIKRSVEDSLQRLQTDYLDIYYLHAPDYSVALQESLQALHELVKAGKVRYPALSNYSAWQACQMQWLCERHSLQPPVISQPMYNLLARGIEQEYVPCCEALGLSMVVYNPLARGLLAGQQTRESPSAGASPQEYQRLLDRYQHPAYDAAVRELQALARRCGRSLIDLALNWLLHHTATDCVILAGVDPGQLEHNLSLFDHGALSEECIAGCDAVWRDLRGKTPKYNR
jgi:1-deoxyxylulose-5-phosphate synthase